MGKKRDYGASEDTPDACFGGLGTRGQGQCDALIPEEAADQRRRSDLVEHVVVDKPVLKGLALDRRGR